MVLGAAAAAQSPLWQLLLVASAGGFLALAGVMITQLATSRREDRKARQEQLVRDREAVKILLVDIAEFVEDRQTWLRHIDYGDKADQASLPVHRNQLAGRIKLFAPPPVVLYWSELTDKLGRVEEDLSDGGHHHSPGAELADVDQLMCVPYASVCADIGILLLRSVLERFDQPLDKKAFLADVRGLARGYDEYGRRARALKEWLNDAEQPSSPWHQQEQRPALSN